MILNSLFKIFFTLLFLSINTQASEDDSLEGDCIDEPLSVTVEYSPVRKISIKGAMSLEYFENDEESYNAQNQRIQKKVFKIFKAEYNHRFLSQSPFNNLDFYQCIISKKFMADMFHLIVPLFRGCCSIYYEKCIYLADKHSICEIVNN
jgi:hypothetical protein